MLVTEIQRFCTHDGPGVRTTVFFKGCPLSCVWCHNPETRSPKPQIFFNAKECIACGGCASACPNGCHTLTADGHLFDVSLCVGCGICADVCPTGACENSAREMTVGEIFEKIKRDIPFYGSNGGVTLSGGEPLIRPEAAELLKLCRENGIGTAVETCGYVDSGMIAAAAAYTDLFLWDIKGGERRTHFENTGAYPEKILENLRLADSLGAKTVLRCIAVNGRNMSEYDIAYIADVYSSLSNCLGVEIIPYHAYGGSKSVLLGFPDSGRAEWIPSAGALGEISAKLSAAGVRLIEHN